MRNGWVVALLVCTASLASAQEHNFRSYIVGGRAAGMGGAFTALANDGSGAYYNPGGLAFAVKSSLSLAASVYGLVRGTLANALGPGVDFSYSDMNAFPVSASVVLKFGARDTPDGSQRNAFGLSLFIPDGVRIDDRSQLGARENTFFITDEVQTLWGGASYARRIGRLGLGVSGFLLIGNQKELIDISVASGGDFALVTIRGDETVYGIVGSAGARVDLTDHLRLGLSVFSPAFGTGSRRLFARNACHTATPVLGCPGFAVAAVDNLDAAPSQPLRVQLGTAWESKRGAVAFDVVLLGPREVASNAGMFAQGIDVSRVVKPNTVANVSLGGELVLAERFPLRSGFFTDFSAADEPRAGPAPATGSGPTKINRYGGTLSIGYKGENSSVDLGAIVSYGSGSATNNQNGTLVLLDASQFFAYVFVTSAYEF